VRKDFGCKGNGIADDTQCLQNAINAGTKNRRHVHVPGGIYLVTRSLLIYGSNQSMLPYEAVSLDMTGDGKQNSIIQAWAPGTYHAPNMVPNVTAAYWGNITSSATGNLGVFEYPTCCGGDPSYGSGFHLADMTVDANNVADYGILAPAVAQSTFERLCEYQLDLVTCRPCLLTKAADHRVHLLECRRFECQRVWAIRGFRLGQQNHELVFRTQLHWCVGERRCEFSDDYKQ
jgi:hypothetical protein